MGTDCKSALSESETKMLTYTKHYYNGSQRISSKIGKAIEFGDVPVRTVFLDFGLPAPPTDLYTAENQTLNNASNTLKDIIIEFGVQQPVPNPYLLENQSGSRNRNNFTYEDTETEQFWFIHGIFFYWSS